ncbi:MAG TPA: hypothetical protein VMW80_10290 [Candidatus Dormibacteraeota bacterium]|nr:hypothetical protein [Candidatus Dormibacteraeota bacterium]
MRNTGLPSVLLTAAAALLVGGALLLANELTPISGWACIVLGLGLLAVGVALDRPALGKRLVDGTGRALAATTERARKASVTAASPVSGEVPRPRTSGRCRGSTDGHHRWSRDPGVCMLCGEQIPDGRR